MPSISPQAGRAAAAAGIAALALVVFVGAVALGIGRAPSSAPTPSLSPTPSPAPTAPVAPTPAPTSDPSDGPTVIVLDTIDENDPRVVVDDQTGTLSDVRAGEAGDGMSTRWNTAIVDQVDPETVRITWVGFPGDELAVLTIVASDGSVVLKFDQNAPPANSDALGADRVLVLTFDHTVNADDVDVTFPPLVPAS